MKKIISVLCAISVVFTLAMLTACGEKYNDGTYTGRSAVHTNDEEEDAGDGYGEVTIVIKDNKIVSCTFNTYEPDGTLKDKDYGKKDGVIANRDYYARAQRAVAANAVYAEALVKNGKLSKVDAVSGATLSYNEFVEAVNDALEKAKK